MAEARASALARMKGMNSRLIAPSMINVSAVTRPACTVGTVRS